MPEKGYNQFDKDGNYIGEMRPKSDPPDYSIPHSPITSSSPLDEFVGGFVVIVVLFCLVGFCWVLMSLGIIPDPGPLHY